MSKSVIILGVIIVAAIVMDAIIAVCYNAWLAKVGKQYTTWNAREHRHRLYGKDHLAFMVLMLLAGAATVLWKELTWLRYVGLALAALYLAFSLFRIIYVYSMRDGKLSKDNFLRRSFPRYVFTSFFGNRFLLYCVSSAALTYVWITFKPV